MAPHNFIKDFMFLIGAYARHNKANLIFSKTLKCTQIKQSDGAL